MHVLIVHGAVHELDVDPSLGDLLSVVDVSGVMPRPEVGWNAAQDPKTEAWSFEPSLPPAVDLLAFKASLSAAVDAAAETQRLRFITGGAGQAMIYLQKQTQAAQALADPSPTAARYPLLAAEVGVTVDPQTEAPAADVVGVARAIAGTVQAWLPIAGAIEGARLKGKAAVAAAATAVEARAAFAAVAWPAG